MVEGNAEFKRTLKMDDLFQKLSSLNEEELKEIEHFIKTKKTNVDYSKDSSTFYQSLRGDNSIRRDDLYEKDLEIQKLKKQIETLKREAYYNPISGLPNKQYYDRLINELLNSNQAFSIAMLDLNNLKQLNDTHGHLFADKIIKIVGKKIKSCIRNDDIVTHWGGDEFVILFPVTERKEARKIIKRVQKICNEPLTMDGITIRPIISAGISYCSSAEKYEESFVQADKAMYINKAMIKNGCSILSAFVCRHDEETLKKVLNKKYEKAKLLKFA